MFLVKFYCIRKRIFDFQFKSENSPLEFLKMFNLLKLAAKAVTEGGPIVFTYVLFLGEETYSQLSIYSLKFNFLRR